MPARGGDGRRGEVRANRVRADAHRRADLGGEDVPREDPASASIPAPWLGIVGEEDDGGSVHGVRVRAVAPQSPAQKAGLKSTESDGAPDRIVAVDGAPVDTPQKLADAIAKHAPGDSVKLLVLGTESEGHPAAFREVSVVLRAAP